MPHLFDNQKHEPSPPTLRLLLFERPLLPYILIQLWLGSSTRRSDRQSDHLLHPIAVHSLRSFRRCLGPCRPVWEPGWAEVPRFFAQRLFFSLFFFLSRNHSHFCGSFVVLPRFPCPVLCMQRCCRSYPLLSCGAASNASCKRERHCGHGSDRRDRTSGYSLWSFHRITG